MVKEKIMVTFDHEKGPIIRDEEKMEQLTTKSGWKFQIEKGKGGRARWTLYDAGGKFRAVSHPKGFENMAAAKNDLLEMCDALDKQLLQNLFE